MSQASQTGSPERPRHRALGFLACAAAGTLWGTGFFFGKIALREVSVGHMVLYRFGSTGVNQVLTRASELLGLVPVFPVRNIGTFGSGEAGTSGGDRAAVFRDCVLVKKGSTVGDVYRKVMGDAPMAYVETVGGIRVAEDDEVKVGKNDVSCLDCFRFSHGQGLFSELVLTLI